MFQQPQEPGAVARALVGERRARDGRVALQALMVGALAEQAAAFRAE